MPEVYDSCCSWKMVQNSTRKNHYNCSLLKCTFFEGIFFGYTFKGKGCRTLADFCRRAADFLSESNRVKICRAISLPHSSRYFVATYRVEVSIPLIWLPWHFVIGWVARGVRRSGLMVCALFPAASGPGSSPAARFSKAPDSFPARKATFRSSVSKNGAVCTSDTCCMRGTSLHL